ncbi:MAG TPA: glycerol-3-phosphate 1-O-acyltransferase PlsY [Gemmatimonadales bacterium]|nr:glycerol-3-phosphate 1-O-acyltransferase PlsY [Gemmatimonadales bacterium]
MHPAVALALAYLSGSFPTAYLAGRTKGIDLRKHGSGNLGTTNVFRVLGWQLGILVFVVDALKGALPVIFLPGLVHASRPDLWALAFGVAAIAGHVKPVFLLGKGGGKGVATATGVFASLAPVAVLGTFALFVIVVLASGYVSLGSLVSAVLLPIAVLLTQGASPVFWIAAAVGAFVVWMHRGNIGRLRRGEESGFRRRGVAKPPLTEEAE